MKQSYTPTFASHKPRNSWRLSDAIGRLGVACGIATLVASGALAQSETAPATPATETPAAEEEAAPTGANLGPVNELVLEGSYAEAEELLATMQEEFPEDAALLLLRGEVLLALRNPKDAVTALTKSLEVDSEQPRASFQLATALTGLGKPDEALPHFEAAAASENAQIKLMARLNRSTLFAQSRKWTEAAGELELVLGLQPDNIQVYGDLASMYLRAGKTDEVIEVLGRGKAAGFQSAQHYYSLGARLYRDEKHEQAVTALQSAVELDPGMAKAERSLAASLEKIGKDKEAIAHFRKYLDLAPNADDAEQIAAKIKSAETP